MRKPVRTTIEAQLGVFACLFIAATTNAHADDVGKPGGPGRVRGHVQRPDGSPIIGRVVHLGNRRTVATDKDGAFVLDGVPGTYELWIDHEKEGTVTVYRGLTRRNPKLQHETSHDLPQDRKPVARKASVSGIVRGDFPFPIDKEHRLVIRFLSETAGAGWSMGSRMGQDGNSQGPRFGRMRVVWNGKPSLTGALVAFGSKMEKGNPLLDPVYGVQTVVVNDNAETTTEITLNKLATGRIAGIVKPSGGYRSWNGFIDFRLDSGGTMATDCRLDDAWRTEGRYECLAPDFSVLHGQYCMELIDGTAHGSTLQHCGGKIGMTDFSPVFQPPPKLPPLDNAGVVSMKTVLAWSGEAKSVYAVEVRVAYDPEANANLKGFNLQMFTTDTRFAWKELARYGIKTPAGTKYEISISRMFPYRTVDEITSGPPSRNASYQRATSDPIEVKVVE